MSEHSETASFPNYCQKCGRARYYIGDRTGDVDLCRCNQQRTYDGPNTFGWPFIDYNRLADEIARRLRGMRFLGFDDDRKCCICGRDEKAEKEELGFIAPGAILGYGSTQGDGEYVCSECMYGALDPLIKEAREKRTGKAVDGDVIEVSP